MKHAAILLCLLISGLVHAQQCIRFVASPNMMRDISRAVSIDKVKGDTIIAYANKRELAALENLGINYQIIDKGLPKAQNMAYTVDELRQWDCYPIYPIYVEYMQQMASQYPNLCHLDTIGHTYQNRLILSMNIHPQDAGDNAPEFFYSSTIHGDEVTGYYFMLRLIDTLLHGYSTNPEFEELINNVNIYINPLANPDGTYASRTYYGQTYGGDSSLNGAQRYNANDVDLNRNYPDPFGSDPYDDQQMENTAMINYFNQHHFLVSANLHGGAEVLNYPWDSFTSNQRRHPQWQWWEAVCKRFIDTTRVFSSNHYNSVNSSGITPGGDWYVIPNGRQDYVNYTFNCLELTMEVSDTKTLSTNQLQGYWDFQHRSLINYIKEVIAISQPESIENKEYERISIYPNPTSGIVFLEGNHREGIVMDIFGHKMLSFDASSSWLNLCALPQGIYLICMDGRVQRVVKE